MITWPKNEQEHVACRDWLKVRGNIVVAPEAHCLVWMIDGNAAWVVAYDGWIGHTCQVHVVSIRDGLYPPKQLITAVFEYGFNIIDRMVMLAIVNSNNKRAMRLDTWLGFREVHRVPKVMEDGGDMCLLQMDRDECRWLKGASMGKASAPPPPDYTQLAKDQGAANLETAQLEGQLNRPDIITPYGSQTWQDLGNNHYQQTQTLSPDGQKQLDLTNSLKNGLLSGANDYALPAIYDALQTSYKAPGDIQTDWDPTYAPDARLQTEAGLGMAPDLIRGLDLSGAPQLQLPDRAMRQRVEDSIYKQGAQYLDPQFQQAQEGQDTKLSNQGIFRGSEAADRADKSLADQKQQAYGDLRDRAIQQSEQEMEGNYQMGLSAHNTGVQDIMNQANFGNSARSQAVSELMNSMGAKNNAIMNQGQLATAQQSSHNTGLQQWLAQMTASKSAPINIMSALMSGGQVQNPQFQPFNNNIQVGQTPIYQAGKDQYGAQVGAANLQAGNSQSTMNGVVGLASAAAMAFYVDLYENPELVKRVTQECMARGETVFQIHRLAESERGHVRELLRFFNPEAFSKVIDLGCGVGAVAQIMHELRPDLHFLLLNNSQEQLDLCSPRFERVCRSYEELSGLCAQDAMMQYALGHGNLQLLMLEVFQVLPKEGTFFLYEMVSPGPQNEIFHELNYTIYSREEILRAADLAGFQVLKEHYPEQVFVEHFYNKMPKPEFDRLFAGVRPWMLLLERL